MKQSNNIENVSKFLRKTSKLVEFTLTHNLYSTTCTTKLLASEVCRYALRSLYLMTIISSFQEKLFADGLQPKLNACYSCHLSRRGPPSCVEGQNQQLLKVQAIKTLHV